MFLLKERRSHPAEDPPSLPRPTHRVFHVKGHLEMGPLVRGLPKVDGVKRQRDLAHSEEETLVNHKSQCKSPIVFAESVKVIGHNFQRFPPQISIWDLLCGQQ
jgi:hypothetical protein